MTDKTARLFHDRTGRLRQWTYLAEHSEKALRIPFLTPFLHVVLRFISSTDITVYPFIYERVNRYVVDNRYMYLTFFLFYGMIKVSNKTRLSEYKQ